MILTPKNWKSFQHYKDRSPPWIKLHHGLLDNYDFCCLPVASKALAPFLWLLASEYEDGKIDASLDAMAFRLRMTRGELTDALAPLIERGFFDASEPLADGKQPAMPETERETERETDTQKQIASDFPRDAFDQFWKRYPRREGKQAAQRRFEVIKKSGRVAFAKLIEGVDRYAAACRNKDPQYVKQPTTWLNAGCWDDEAPPPLKLVEPESEFKSLGIV